MYYDGNKKSAWIKGDVHFIEKDIQLTCSDLKYDLNNKTAYYYSRAHIYSTQNQNKLTLEYDKKEININEMIKLLSDNNILFTELKTYDEDLESIFLKMTSNLDKKI